MTDDVTKFAAFALWFSFLPPDPGIFCPCRLDPDSPACRRRKMQGRRLRRRTRPRCSATDHRSHSHRVPAGARVASTGNSGDGDDGGGGGPPHPGPRPADYDRALALKLVARIATAIVETVDDGALAQRIPEIAAALIAAQAHFLARDPALVRPPTLGRALDAVRLLLLKNVAAALRVAAGNGRAR